jgi:hypothetical protein
MAKVSQIIPRTQSRTRAGADFDLESFSRQHPKDETILKSLFSKSGNLNGSRSKNGRGIN